YATSSTATSSWSSAHQIHVGIRLVSVGGFPFAPPPPPPPAVMVVVLPGCGVAPPQTTPPQLFSDGSGTKSVANQTSVECEPKSRRASAALPAEARRSFSKNV